MIVRRAIKADAIVPGAGSIELELSKHLRLYSRENEGKIVNFNVAKKERHNL